jgi:hypothetical protein
MDIKKNVLLIGRIEEEDEEDEEKENKEGEEDDGLVQDVTDVELDQSVVKAKPKVKKLENVVFIGRMEENENFEENPVIEEGALSTIVEASTKHKTLIFEVIYIVLKISIL